MQEDNMQVKSETKLTNKIGSSEKQSSKSNEWLVFGYVEVKNPMPLLAPIAKIPIFIIREVVVPILKFIFLGLINLIRLIFKGLQAIWKGIHNKIKRKHYVYIVHPYKKQHHFSFKTVAIVIGVIFLISTLSFLITHITRSESQSSYGSSNRILQTPTSNSVAFQNPSQINSPSEQINEPKPVPVEKALSCPATFRENGCPCVRNGHCDSGFCSSGKCQRCSSDSDCYTNQCADGICITFTSHCAQEGNCEQGRLCAENANCLSNLCENNKCA
jgi:hypothetical protein